MVYAIATLGLTIRNYYVNEVECMLPKSDIDLAGVLPYRCELFLCLLVLVCHLLADLVFSDRLLHSSDFGFAAVLAQIHPGGRQLLERVVDRLQLQLLVPAGEPLHAPRARDRLEGGRRRQALDARERLDRLELRDVAVRRPRAPRAQQSRGPNRPCCSQAKHQHLRSTVLAHTPRSPAALSTSRLSCPGHLADRRGPCAQADAGRQPGDRVPRPW